MNIGSAIHVHDNLHKKYDFEKTQEILGNDIGEGLRILEDNIYPALCW